MNRLIGINEASKRLGVSISTLRRWDETGVLVAERTPKGHRRYDLNKINSALSSEQKAQFENQIALLKQFCREQDWDFELVDKLGIGIIRFKKE